MTLTYLVVIDLIAVIGFLFCLAIPRLRKYAIDLLLAPFAFATAALGGFILVVVCIKFATQHYGLEIPDGSSLMCAAISYVTSGLGGIFMSHKILNRYRPVRESKTNETSLF